MYLRRVHIKNVRSIAELTWELPEGVDGAGWHVILGDNGAGKSTFLRSIALALVGPAEAAGLRQSWLEWIRVGAESAQIDLNLTWDIAHDGFSGRGKAPNQEVDLTVGVDLTRSLLTPSDSIVGPYPIQHVWGGGLGWFCASYGPFRRFTGGDKDLEKLYITQPKLARHLSVFGEAVALTEALTWLQSLKFKQLEGHRDGDLLAPVRTFINQSGFLPHEVRFEDVTSNGVQFVDASGFKVPVENLSDGYRSVLSMTFELVRQMALTYGTDGLFSADHTQVIRPGVVIVDEIDAHLHPTWQRTIGVWFRKHFPNVQFIVSTHSPLICQAAEVGSVFRLPSPGADAAEDRGEIIDGIVRRRLLYGNVLDAYGTGVFGDGVSRSDSGQEMLERLAKLNTKELRGSLSDDERKDQAELRDTLPTEASPIQKP